MNNLLFKLNKFKRLQAGGYFDKLGTYSEWDKLFTDMPKLTPTAPKSTTPAGRAKTSSNVFKNPVTDADRKTSNSNKLIGSALSVGSSILNSFDSDLDKQPGDSLRANKLLDYSKNSNLSTGLSTAIGAASALDPSGATAVAKGALDAGAALSNIIDKKDEYGVSKSNFAKAVGNNFNVLGNIQDAVNEGRKYGFGAGLKNFVTFGVSGNNRRADLRDSALNKDRMEDAQAAQGTNIGKIKNNSVYAKKGGYIKYRQNGGGLPPSRNNSSDGDVEVEDGEVLLTNPATLEINSSNAKAKSVSPYGMIIKGDKHGEDTDKDGNEGIRITSDNGAYVGSNYLTIDGAPAKNGQKTVADEMKPLINILSKAKVHSTNPFINNPVMISETNRQLEEIKRKAEIGKFQEGLKKESKKGDINSLITYITQSAPLNDLEEKDREAVKRLISASQLSKSLFSNK